VKAVVQAYGSDRLRVSDDGRLFLSSRVQKAWRERSVRAASAIPHPGTAVLWDDLFYEVIAMIPLPSGGFQYELALFPDDLMMRETVAYDESSELANGVLRRSMVHRERSRRILNALAPITGHAPPNVQEWMHQELGTFPSGLTAISAIPPIALGLLSIRWMLNEKVDGIPLPFPKLLVIFLVILGIESAYRLFSAVFQGRPAGSVPGFVVYAIVHALFLRHTAIPSVFAVRHGDSVRHSAPPPDVALQDALAVREPFLTLLAVSDQQKLTDRYGFSPARYGRKTAVVILGGSAIGTLTSVGGLFAGHGLTSLLSLILSAWLAIEQVVRWPALATTGASSVLRFVVRPLAGKLLD
jgi:hypothetical protein